MEGELLQGNLGSVGKYDVAFKEGGLVAEVKADMGPANASVMIKLDAAKVIDALAAAIPGTVDDAVFGLIKAALLGK